MSREPPPRMRSFSGVPLIVLANLSPLRSAAVPTETNRDGEQRAERDAGREGADQRSPGVLTGYSETGIERSSAVSTIRDCSATCAAG